MEARKTNEIDMTTGRILPKLLAATLPLMASSVLQLLFNAADVVVVGNFASEHSLAAVGSTGALVNLIVNLFVGLSIGAAVVASFYYGAQDDQKLSKTAHSAMLLSLVGGALLTLLGVCFAETFLVWTRVPPEVLPLATQYMRVYFAGIVAVMVFNFGASLLRAKGDTKRPLYYLTIAGFVNVGLNLLFVVAFKMDVAGVALATVISQALAAWQVVKCLMNENDAFRIEPRKLRFDRPIVSEILKSGIPAGVQGCVFALSNVVIQSSVNGFGPVVMAGSAGAQNVEGFVWVSMYAFSQTALTFVGQNVGAKKFERLGRITLATLACALVTGLILGSFCDQFGSTLMRIYDDRPEVIASGAVRFSLVCRFYFLCGLMDAMVGVIRGMGRSIAPTVVSLLGACGLRLVWIATIFQIPRFHTEFVLFASYPVSWLITFAAHVACYWYFKKQLTRPRPL